MKNVMLKIKGTQNPVGNNEDVIELITEGKYYDKDNARYLVYEESELSGMEGCTTTLKITDDKVELKRFGRATSKLVFEKGKRHVSNYSTPYGNFRMEILTKKLDLEMDEKEKRKISLEYRISLQGLSEGTNKLDIEIM
ncbi:DUF1934 domain-containing protein [Maledivibacter halophilus]|uniref:Uncharacterized beta-barrel protein YwiB, DUF1934 family n=1 Tax=Maledivibacter halophilus TaxID=36842 RepID=A0A1T5K498_9FIRM|nr:DUF1934 domain-containing protein [Maledivibacter halophilus]SKC58414.1 Uncharacterized beta-barrel protein YwiB, DUF1934 family [Maledivibacter halophilus]